MITLLTGPNTYTISEAIHDASTVFDGELERYDGSELETRQLPDIFMGGTLFSPRRMIVLRDLASNKQLWGDLEQWVERVPEETDIFLVEPNPDKRTRTYKLLQKHASIREHKDLVDAELVNWLQQRARSEGAELQPDVIRYLITYVGRDQWRLSSELEKLLLSEKPVTQQLIRDVVEPYPEATAFELLDAVFRRDAKRVEELVNLLSGREDPYQFFGLLSSQAMALLALVANSSKRPADIAGDLGLHPFVLAKLAPVARNFGRPRAERFIENLAYCDNRIKTSGVNPWQQLKLTLLEACSS